MDENLKSVSSHMRELGLAALAHANWHAKFHSMENPYWGELSVLQAAHAAEILIKARIAEEHPLLIFETLPKIAKASDSQIDLEHLLENGRTYQYGDLPDRLWAATGIRLPGLDVYRAFGKLRNTIQHFTTPNNCSVSYRSSEFIYNVVDPFVNQCWGLYAIDYCEDHEPYIYLVEELIHRGVRFLISPGMLECIEYIRFDWPDDEQYVSEMNARIDAAKAAMDE